MSELISRLKGNIHTFQQLHSHIKSSIDLHSQFMKECSTLYQQCLDYKNARLVQGQDIAQRASHMPTLPFAVAPESKAVTTTAISKQNGRQYVLMRITAVSVAATDLHSLTHFW
jgi:hypothetical protein